MTTSSNGISKWRFPQNRLFFSFNICAKLRGFLYLYNNLPWGSLMEGIRCYTRALVYESFSRSMHSFWPRSPQPNRLRVTWLCRFGSWWSIHVVNNSSTSETVHINNMNYYNSWKTMTIALTLPQHKVEFWLDCFCSPETNIVQGGVGVG